MEILGSIQCENVQLTDRHALQKRMRKLIRGLRGSDGLAATNVGYRVFLWRTSFAATVEVLIELRIPGCETCFARAHGENPEESFYLAADRLAQMEVESRMRGSNQDVEAP